MQRSFPLTLLSLVAIVILVACGQGTPDATATPVPTDTPIPTATFTATPSTPLAILVMPADLDPAQYELYQSTVYNLAQQAGFRFQVRNTLSEADLEPGLRVVVALPPDPGIAALAAAAPQTQFLAINIPGLTAGGNISVLANDVQTDIVAFMAGYIGALITEDYRIGMIYPDGNAEALSALDAFTNGKAYYCGTCRPFYYLPYEFPQSIPIPTTEPVENYGGYAVYLIQQREVDFIYVYPGIASPELLAYVGSSGAVQVGSPPTGSLPLYWAASITPDTIGAIEAAWPNLVAGQGGQTVQSPLTITDVDATLLSPAKQAEAEQVMAELLAGRISPHGVQ